ncbi:MAG: D-glycero-beta-D-manno-heptose-7-phosphate kinase [Cyclobacteriaceae bacterium]|nr:D-glycero-beta-D-manno-heptose-7-phosphate kinase [Cyclobacteriaceae bacterium]
MRSWPDIFKKFDDLTVLIIGDVMVDAYIWGAVERISPEAPVPVVAVKNRDFRLGGAANVALNVASLGAKPVLCALVGQDDHGKKLLHMMDEKGMSREGIVISASRPTTVKTRVIAAHQHVVRIDDESDEVATTQEEKDLLGKIEKLTPTCQVIIFEDYDKGVITPEIIKHTVALAAKHGIPTVVDPKKRNFLHYNQVTLFKPNLKEIREGLKIDIDAKEPASLESGILALKDRLRVEGVMLTLSEHGVLIDYKNQKILLPAHAREIADVSGAGDTVVSIAALTTALRLSPKEIAALSNLGGGLVCQHVGVVPIDKSELLREAEKL